MTIARVGAASVAAFLVLFFGGFTVHGGILGDAWATIHKDLGKPVCDPTPGALLPFVLADLIRGSIAALIGAVLASRIACPFAGTFATAGVLFGLTSLAPRLTEVPIGIYPVAFLAKIVALELVPCLAAAALVVAVARRGASAGQEAAVERRELVTA